MLAGYDTSPRGELLVSTFTAAMHRKEAMAGHVLPVILSFHLGITLNDVAGSAKGALDPQEFWHAWARGEAVKVDLFDPSWDFWAATREPIDALRARHRAQLRVTDLCPDSEDVRDCRAKQRSVTASASRFRDRYLSRLRGAAATFPSSVAGGNTAPDAIFLIF